MKKMTHGMVCMLLVFTLIFASGGLIFADTPSESAIESPSVPSAPKLKVSSAKSKQVTLKWKKTTNASKYQIYQKKGSGKWKRIKTLSASKTKYTKKKLSMKKTYTYKIRVMVDGVWSPFSSIVKKVKVKGKYTQPSMYGGKLTGKELRKVRDKVANFTNKNQTWRLSEFEKADLAAQYIANTITYSNWYNSKYYNTAYGGLIKKKGACSAYMRAYKALADGMGLKCKCIHTKVSYTAHQWCHVKIDGKWYILETQIGWWVGKVKKSNKNSNEVYENYYVMKK